MEITSPRPFVITLLKDRKQLLIILPQINREWVALGDRTRMQNNVQLLHHTYTPCHQNKSL